MDVLATTLADLKSRGVRPKYIYTIPTVQNPTGSIMPESRRGRAAAAIGPIWRADLRGRLLCRPRLVRATATGNLCDEPERRRDPYRLVLQVDRAGAARRLRRRALGCDVADALAQDGCRLGRAGADGACHLLPAAFFAAHVPALTKALRTKLDTLMEALNEQFGTAAEFEEPKGGIFLWVKLPDQVDTLKLYPGRARRRRLDQSGAGMVHQQEPFQLATAAVLREPDASADPRGRSPCSPTSAVRSSACRRAAPMWRSRPELIV